MRSLKALKTPKEENTPKEEVLKKTNSQLENELIQKIDLSFVGRNTKQLKKVGGFHPSYTNQCSRFWY